MQNDSNGVPIETERDLLIKLATDVGHIKRAVDELKQDIKRTNEEYDRRIGKLEEWRAYVLGASAVVAFLISVIMSLWRH